MTSLNAYLTRNYQDLLDVSCTIVRGDGRELLHDVVGDLLVRGVPDGIMERGEGKQAEIRRYIIASMRLAYHSRTSRYYRRHKRDVERCWEHADRIRYELYESSEDPVVNVAIQFLHDKLDELPDFERSVCILWYNGHPLTEISEQTGISKSTLSKALNRARQELKDEVKRTWGHYRENYKGNRH